MSVATLGGFPADAGGLGATVQGRSTLGQQKPLFNQARAGTSTSGRSVLPARVQPQALTASIAELDPRTLHPQFRGQHRTFRPNIVPIPAFFPACSGPLPEPLYRLLDPSASVELPPAHRMSRQKLDNRELDKLVAALGRSKVTWRRAILLHEWLQEIGHRPDDRLCTTLIRLCSAHGAATQALGLYDWMKAPASAGGAGLQPTVFTYTAAMRAALNGNMPERAMKVWEDAKAARCTADCRMCTVYIEVCTRAGSATAALDMYKEMATAPAGSKLAPSVHTYTAAMRAAAAEGGTWHEALTIWDDMLAAGCTPTGHSYAAAISACATGGEWRRAVQLFDNMLASDIQPDVVSCTALISALAADGQYQHAERALDWMLEAGVRPNVRTYTALITAQANAHQWERALGTLRRLKTDHSWRRVEPNAYTYSALIKLLGEHGQWALAEEIFSELEGDALKDMGCSPSVLSDVRMPPVRTHPEPAVLPTTPGDIWGITQASHWQGDDDAAPADSASASPASDSVPILRAVSNASDLGSDIMSTGSYGAMPKALAEQVLDDLCAGSAPSLPGTAASSFADLTLGLPDSIPGQSNVGSPRSTHNASSSCTTTPSSRALRSDHSDLSHRVPGSMLAMEVASASSSSVSDRSYAERPARGHGMAVSPFQAHMPEPSCMSPAESVAGEEKPQPVLNVVVCGTLMAAYEQVGRWRQAVQVLSRARRLGIKPNNVMFNIALSALGKGGEWQAAESMFEQVDDPDIITYETMVAATGMAGQPERAEAWLQAMQSAGHHPRDYSCVGLIAGYSLSGDTRSALRVRTRMARMVPAVEATVHVYNALIAACDREGLWDKAMQLHTHMRREGITPNQITTSLMAGVGKSGSSAIEKQQAVAAAMSAAVAAAGGFIMRAGAF